MVCRREFTNNPSLSSLLHTGFVYFLPCQIAFIVLKCIFQHVQIFLLFDNWFAFCLYYLCFYSVSTMSSTSIHISHSPKPCVIESTNGKSITSNRSCLAYICSQYVMFGSKFWFNILLLLLIVAGAVSSFYCWFLCFFCMFVSWIGMALQMQSHFPSLLVFIIPRETASTSCHRFKIKLMYYVDVRDIFSHCKYITKYLIVRCVSELEQFHLFGFAIVLGTY